ncbi:MAG TPA: ATP-binding protein [Candidatus Eisenbacteria bacterium]|nr:ATP-binding protein [Candidatus Eisenbacteria bacterium]
MHGSLSGFRVLSGPGALGRVVTRLRELLPAVIRKPEERSLVLLAVEEAAVNILEHGYRNDSGRPLSIWVRALDDGRFQVMLRDRAPLTDVTIIAPGDLKELARTRASRGRGLALMRLLTSSMTHRPRHGGGNELILVFDTVHLGRVIEEHFRNAA